MEPKTHYYQEYSIHVSVEKSGAQWVGMYRIDRDGALIYRGNGTPHDDPGIAEDQGRIAGESYIDKIEGDVVRFRGKPYQFKELVHAAAARKWARRNPQATEEDFTDNYEVLLHE